MTSVFTPLVCISSQSATSYFQPRIVSYKPRANLLRAAQTQIDRAPNNSFEHTTMCAYPKVRRQRETRAPASKTSCGGLNGSLQLLLLLLSAKHCALGEAVGAGGNYTYYGNTLAGVNSLRFRDFEPRFPSSELVTKAAASTVADGDLASGVRKARGLHFQADGKDVTVDLEFIIPFMHIPIERSMQVTTSAFRKLVSLNTGTLLLSGAVVVVGAAIAGILKLLSGPTLYGYGYKKSTRAANANANVNADAVLSLMDGFSHGPGDGSSESLIKSNDFLGMVETKLHERHINVSACAQKSICSYVQKASASVSSGAGTPMERIVDGFVRLDLLQHYLNGSALQEAIVAGQQNGTQHCEDIYHRCKWPQPENTITKVLLDYFRYYASKIG